jgi:putative ABC transport system permease protein
LVSGTFVLTETIQKAFDGVFMSSYRNSSVIISGKEIVKARREEAAEYALSSG